MMPLLGSVVLTNKHQCYFLYWRAMPPADRPSSAEKRLRRDRQGAIPAGGPSIQTFRQTP